MDVTHNGTVPESLHSVTENIPGRSPDDVFHELGPIAFQAFPILSGPDAFVGYGFPSELVFPDPGFHIGKTPAAGKFDEQHTALAREANVVHPNGDPLLDGRFHRPIYLLPEIYDVGIG